MTEKGTGMDDKACQAVADLAAAVLSDPAAGAILARLHAGHCPLVLAGPGGLLRLGVGAALAASGHPPVLLAPGDLGSLPVPSTVVLVSDGGTEGSSLDTAALTDFLDRGGEVVLFAPAATPWAVLASRKDGRLTFIPFGEGIDTLAEARREIARLHLRLTLYAQQAALPPASRSDVPMPPPPAFATASGYPGAPLTGSEGRKGRSFARSLKMAGYALFPYNRRRKLKRRQMMAALWGQ